MSISHDGFVTTGKRRFERDSFPMRLFQKAKQLGGWDPYAIDLTADRENWPDLPGAETEAIVGTVAVFQAGEESVTLDLLPLIMAVALEGRIEEEMYLTTFLFEEAKHTEFFNRWLREVAGIDGDDLSGYLTPAYRQMFYDELPAAMWALKDDPSPANQLRASVTYNMIVEGVLAETGYYGFYYQSTVSDDDPLLPGLLEGIAKLRQDESRHMAYGVYLISRLVAAHSELWEQLQGHMARLLPIAMTFLNERMQQVIDKYGALPWGTDPSVFVQYAQKQYMKRMTRLEKARNRPLAELDRMAIEEVAA